MLFKYHYLSSCLKTKHNNKIVKTRYVNIILLRPDNYKIFHTPCLRLGGMGALFDLVW